MKKVLVWLLCLGLGGGAGACTQKPASMPIANATSPAAPVAQPAPARNTQGLAVATFASGCFWCSEEVFEQLQGVQKVVSGYTGGTVKNPTYEQVTTGQTQHAEAIQIWYDSTRVSYNKLLEVFFASHDPTTLNRQGPDAGTQYRSAIFYRNASERSQAQAYINKLNQSGEFNQPIITQVEPLGTFYQAEQYHQDYFKLHPNDPYMRAISKPKVNKVKEKFPDMIK